MDKNKLLNIYNCMLKIRMVEEAIVFEYPLQEIRTPVHLYIGQEAIAAGVSINLEERDFIVSNHRSHGHCLAKGMELVPFFKELYGKAGGVSGGYGGSMHLRDMKRGIIGTSAIVAGGIPIGAGVALSQKLSKTENITVIYFGDGAVDEGVFWETLNFCALQSLPVLFVMEDNHYASQTPIEQRHGYKDITKIVQGFDITTVSVDGNDAIAVSSASEDCIMKIRSGRGPFFMYCQTYRWKGHVGYIEDTGYRTVEEIEHWKEKCPVQKMERHLQRFYTDEAEEIILRFRDYWQREIAQAIVQAKEAPYAMD